MVRGLFHDLCWCVGYFGGLAFFFYLIFLFMRWLTRVGVDLYRRFR